MLASPADEYMPLIIAMMIAFVAGALAFILMAEFVRRRTRGKAPPPKDVAGGPSHNR
ncbi:MAG TPA: hypothetical protein VGI81_08595 [Tepidisphaeraceae bacterium]|jgi:hypothetical protein